MIVIYDDSGQILRWGNFDPEINCGEGEQWLDTHPQDLSNKWVNPATKRLRNKPTLPPNWNAVRVQRTALLAASDWTMAADAALNPAQKAEAVVYRQALRDITKAVKASDVVWPVKPAWM